MVRIIDVPIESLPERYSTDWARWFEAEYKRLAVPYLRINPEPLSYDLETGSFLNVIGTHYYKSKQTAKICSYVHNKAIHDSDVFLFHDLWHQGIIALAYIRDAMNLKFKIVGCLHAGSYDPYDFLAKKGMGYWAEDFENSLFKIIDKIFVATEFHKRLLTTTRKVDPKKVIVTGFPIYHERKLPLHKKNIIVFPHRLDSEKNPHLFDIVVNELQKIYRHDFTQSEWKFIKSKDVCKTKQEYYDLLDRARISVSFADQETWGIAMLESLFAGCIPVVPQRLSYTEMYDPSFQFAMVTDAVDLIAKMMFDPEDFDEIAYSNREQQLKKGAAAIENMIQEILC